MILQQSETVKHIRKNAKSSVALIGAQKVGAMLGIFRRGGYNPFVIYIEIL